MPVFPKLGEALNNGTTIDNSNKLYVFLLKIYFKYILMQLFYYYYYY